MSEKEIMEEQIANMLDLVLGEENDQSYLSIAEIENPSFIEDQPRVDRKAQTVKPINRKSTEFKQSSVKNNNFHFKERAQDKKFKTQVNHQNYMGNYNNVRNISNPSSFFKGNNINMNEQFLPKNNFYINYNNDSTQYDTYYKTGQRFSFNDIESINDQNNSFNNYNNNFYNPNNLMNLSNNTSSNNSNFFNYYNLNYINNFDLNINNDNMQLPYNQMQYYPNMQQNNNMNQNINNQEFINRVPFNKKLNTIHGFKSGYNINQQNNLHNNKRLSTVNPSQLGNSKDLLNLKVLSQMGSNIGNNSNTNFNDLAFNELEDVLALLDKIDEFLLLKLKGKFISIIKTQKGSRVFQKYLKNTQSEIIHNIFMELYEKLNSLMTDPYANYFCQKFYGFLSKEDKILFLKQIRSSLINIAISKIGTYPLQGIIEQLTTQTERDIIISTIKDYILNLSQDLYGTHVIEKILICFSEDSIDFIYDIIIDNFLLLAVHNNGLCVIKKIIIHCTKQTTIERILAKLVENALYLIQNPYGNYAIQVAFDYWQDQYLIPIVKQFENKYTNLSMQKYSSNVVEKCLSRFEELCLHKLIEEMSQMSKGAELMKNNYGNYVVQKALKISSGVYKAKLLNILAKSIEKIGDKKIMGKWRSIIGKFANKNECINFSFTSDVGNNLFYIMLMIILLTIIIQMTFPKKLITPLRFSLIMSKTNVNNV